MPVTQEVSELEAKILGLSAIIGTDNDNPDHAESLIKRALLFLETGHYQQAWEDAKSAIRSVPDNIDANVIAGKATLKLKRFTESYTYYKEGLRLSPKDEDVINGLKVLQDVMLADYEEKGQSTPENTYNAVNLCSQDCYPGDDELFKLEVGILLKKHKIDATKCQKPLDVTQAKRKEAATMGVVAYTSHAEGRFTESLQASQIALEKDPSNFRVMFMRGQAFYELNEKVSALRDLVMIPKPYRFLEAWKLGGKILNFLKLPVMAEFWLRKATSLIPEKERTTDLEAQTLFQKIRVERIYGPLTEDYPVRVDFTEYGRTIVAIDKLEKGENAFEDKPVVLGQVLSCMDLPACYNCGYSLITPQDFFGAKWTTMPNELKSFAEEHWPDVKGFTCSSCDRERYCGEKCRTEAWDNYHQILCPSVNPATEELYDIEKNKGQGVNEKGVMQEVWVGQYSPLVLAKIWASITVEVKRQMKAEGLAEPTQLMWSKAKMRYRKFISFGSVSAIKRMPEMFGLMKKIFADCGDGITYPISEAEFEARYYQATCNLQAFSSALTPKNIFMENVSKVEDMRGFKILKYLEEKAPPVLIAGMFPLHACLNHSCDNNVEIMDGYSDGKPMVEVRVKRDTKSGEELFTTYIDTAMPRKLRRAWLYKSFNFWCVCKRCQFEGDDNTTCTKCKKVASEGKKFSGCARCKKAWYCSTKCQKQAWVSGHRDICGTGHSNIASQVNN